MTDSELPLTVPAVGTEMIASPVAVRALTKRFGHLRAIERLTFEVHPGRVTAFLGANGAGKTTTLRILLGLARPSAGEALLFGRPYSRLRHPMRYVGAVLETGSFHPGRTARDHLRVVAAAGQLRPDRVDRVLNLVGLEDAARRRVGGFSLGMRQRLALATALLGDPQVLVLDEPANGLDPEGIRWLRELLRGFADNGGTVLISSHVLADVAQIADDCVIINRGRLVAAGPLGEVGGAGAPRVVGRSPQAPRLAEALTQLGLSVQLAGDRVVVAGTSVETIGEAAAAHAIVLHELRTEEPTLEHVFLSLTADSRQDATAEVLG